MDSSVVRRFAATFVTDTTNPPTPRHGRWRRGRFDLIEIADGITALICFAIANSVLVGVNSSHDSHHSGAVLLLLAFITCAPLALRTRFPLAAWSGVALAAIAASVVLSAGWLAASGYPAVVLLIYGLCIYAVTIRCRPRIVVAAAAVSVVEAGFLDAGSAPGAVFLALIPVLIGVVVRVRRSGELRLAEQERRHSGERALLEERQRIARELHDVVAHHMSVIAIQAEAAPYKMADPPPDLVESFGEIRSSALAGLTELRRVLGVLRADGQETAPQPGLASLDALLDSAASGGLSVTVTSSGDPGPLPEGVDLSAYRIIQEALSNAMRYAPGSQVRLHLAYRPEGLALQIRNDAAPVVPAAAGRVPAGRVTAAVAAGTGAPPVPAPASRNRGGGHGLIGMRERAAMLGGSLDAGPTEDGGFEVAAVLPISHDEPGGAP
jgi:signal transduction histidine kinase